MTHREAKMSFVAEVLPVLIEREENGPDYPLRREAWNTYVDMLHRSDVITDFQADNWCTPSVLGGE